MLYIIHLILLIAALAVVVPGWRASAHAVVAIYCFCNFVVDQCEVMFNLMLKFYSFPTGLLEDFYHDNQLGIIFTDTMILPFTGILFFYFASVYNRWATALIFTIIYTGLEPLYLQLGLVEYHKFWSLPVSFLFYVAGFFGGAYFINRFVEYRPPLPYWIRIMALTYTINMWVGATFGKPLLNLFYFRTGLIDRVFADDRMMDLYAAVSLAILAAILLSWVRSPLRVGIICLLLAGIGFGFSLYSYDRGWLHYLHWNHMLMALRYLVPFTILFIYDRWERPYSGG